MELNLKLQNSMIMLIQKDVLSLKIRQNLLLILMTMDQKMLTALYSHLVQLNHLLHMEVE